MKASYLFIPAAAVALVGCGKPPQMGVNGPGVSPGVVGNPVVPNSPAPNSAAAQTITYQVNELKDGDTVA
jgi:hypothetical protein